MKSAPGGRVSSKDPGLGRQTEHSRRDSQPPWRKPSFSGFNFFLNLRRGTIIS
jgi:hypothetical protein